MEREGRRHKKQIREKPGNGEVLLASTVDVRDDTKSLLDLAKIALKRLEVRSPFVVRNIDAEGCSFKIGLVWIRRRRSASL